MTTRLLMTADAIGGVWQYATELATALRPHGVETTIAVLGPEPNEDQQLPLPVEERELEVIHTGLPLDWLCNGPVDVLAAGEAVASLASDLRADLIHLNSPTLAARTRFPAPTIAVAHGCTATWWRAAHGTAPDPAYAWQADLMRAGLLDADATVAPSASFAADLQRTYALPMPPLAVHNGRSVPSPSLLRGEGHHSGQASETITPAPHALTAGRLWDRVKNTAVLDRVAALLTAPLRAAGPITGPHGETVAPDHLCLLGNLSAADLFAELAQRPVFVSTTSFEPFGLAVLEAAQSGCALVLSDIPTFRELWDGAALFVSPQDDQAFAEAIENLLADPSHRAALGQTASERAARYTPQATATAMASLYARLLTTRRAAA